MSSVAIVPAAGKGERFGGAKLVADVGGVPLLDRTLRCLLDGGVEHVIVVMPPDGRFDSVRLLSDPRVMVVVNPDPSRGMFSSIQAGIEVAQGHPMLVLPGDMPFVSTSTVRTVLAAALQSVDVVVPRHDGRRGHPIALPERLKSHVVQAPATTKLSEVLKASGVPRIEIDVQDPGILRDVDVKGDLS